MLAAWSGAPASVWAAALLLVPLGSTGRYQAEAISAGLFTSPVWQGQEADADCNDSSECVGYMCPKMLGLRKSRGTSEGQRVRHVLDL